MAFLPPELEDIEDDTAVIGNLGAFFRYIRRGQLLRDWSYQAALAQRGFEIELRENSFQWTHIIHKTSPQTGKQEPAVKLELSRPFDPHKGGEAVRRASAAIDRWYKPPGIH